MTKTELADALWAARYALAAAIRRANDDIAAARRALRSHPHLRYYQAALQLAVRAHDLAKHDARNWLDAAGLRDVRAKAAKLVRDDLESRRLRRAFPAAAPLALAA